MNAHKILTRCITMLSLLILVSVSTATTGEVPQVDTVKAPALRDQLLARVERDQAARQAGINWGAEHGVNGFVDEDSLTSEEKAVHDDLWAEVTRIDADNTEWLNDIVSKRGWLTYSDVGIDGGDAAWLLVQHADADPSFQRLCLDLMTGLPRDEVSQENMAYLTDRVMIKEGKKQIYGTQFEVRDGEWVPAELYDVENVDTRRAEIGLPPLAEYKAMLEAVMRGEEIE
jgi:hypothetical protein